jgi:hypothetical protein
MAEWDDDPVRFDIGVYEGAASASLCPQTQGVGRERIHLDPVTAIRDFLNRLDEWTTRNPDMSRQAAANLTSRKWYAELNSLEGRLYAELNSSEGRLRLPSEMEAE